MKSNLKKGLPFLLITVHFLSSPSVALAQQSITFDDFVQQMVDDEESEYYGTSEWIDALYEINSNRININQATADDLRRLPFLTEQDIENILQYVYVYGPVQTLSELQLVNNLDYNKRLYLQLFLCVGSASVSNDWPTLREMAKYGKNEVVVRTDVPIGYKKAGYEDYSDSILARYPNRRYLGNALYHSLRYNFHYKDRVLFGFTAEKDAGEPFFGDGNKAFDSYSYYFMLQNFGFLKKLIVGKYKLAFGQGLVLNSGFQLGKSSALHTLNTECSGISKHSSTSEYGFFNGIALTTRYKHYEQSYFLSYNPTDATLTSDSLISTLKTDGYHRTRLEMSKKNNVCNMLAGSNITFSLKNFKIGSTVVYNYFNIPFKKSTLYYKQYDPVDSRFLTYSVNMQYRSRVVHYSAEIASCNSGGVATVHYLCLTPMQDFNIVLIPRYYSYRYNAINSGSFSAGSGVKNERGIYGGTSFLFFRHFRQDIYADWYCFPKPKYLVSTASHGADMYSLTTWSPTSTYSLSARYRAKKKQKDYKLTDDTKVLTSFWQHTVRVQSDLQVRCFKFKTMGSYTRYASRYSGSNGFLVQQSVAYTHKEDKFRASVDAVWFNTDDYDSRIYAYEHALLYTFSYPSYYAHGWRCAVTGRYSVNNNITVLLKGGMTHYMNKNTIGSSQELINGNHKQDVQVQVKYKF